MASVERAAQVGLNLMVDDHDHASVPHRFVQHPLVVSDSLCGVERYPNDNPGVVCGKPASDPLHDWFCPRCRCVVSGAHDPCTSVRGDFDDDTD